MVSGSSVTVWLDRVKAGDEWATHKLWDRYFERLVRLASRRLPRHARRDSDGEDVALSAFQSFCHRAARDQFPALSARDDLWRLLAVITARKVTGVVRRRSRLKRGGGIVVGESALLESSGKGEKGLDQLLGRDPTPEVAAQFAEDYKRLMDELGDEALRVVARLKLEEHSSAEIAARLGTSSRTIDRKLKLIRRIWEKHASSET
jgi:DNA-directed RNA polymerase specialized sigma24 family protein